MTAKRSTVRATREDVCRAVGVSSATVSRALNNKPGVGAELREKVIASARELNYVPQAAARHLSRAKTDTIGVVFQDLNAGWFMNIFRGIMNRCSGACHVLNTLSTRAGDEFELPHRMLAERRVDGLIWLDQRVTPRMVSKIKDLGAPVVTIQMKTGDRQVAGVSIENCESSAEAVRHLLGLGYRRPVIVTGPRDNSDSKQKWLGVERALAELNRTIPPADVLEGHHMGSHAVRVFSERIKAGPKPDAVFAFNDEMAIAILLWLREHGFRVPGDVAVVGFDGIHESKNMGLTTVETPLFDCGVIAAQLLLEAIADPFREGAARQVLLKGHLCVRETCGAHAVKPAERTS